MTREDVIYERRNTHKYAKNECVYCGCARIKTKHPNNEKWVIYEYAEKETGEVKRTVQCKTKQIQMNI